MDSHSLEGVPAEMRAHLLANSNLPIAASAAEEFVNGLNDVMNGMGLGVGTALLCRALVARGVISMAADWWADSTDPRATVPVTTAVLRSFITDLPPVLIGESYIPEPGA